MTRRLALLALGLLSGYATRGYAAPVAPGVLTLDLGQWKAIRVVLKGQEYYLEPEELFSALRETF